MTSSHHHKLTGHLRCPHALTRNLSSRYAYGLRLLRFRSNQRKPPPLFPSLENEGGSAHPWAREYRCLLRSAAKVRPPLGAGDPLEGGGGRMWHLERNIFPLKSITRQKMSPTSVSGGVHFSRREHISRLVERPRGGFAYGKSGTMAL